MQLALVEPLARTDRREVDAVRVVGDEQDARLDGFAVDRDAERMPVCQDRRPRAHARECLAPATVVLAPVHESRVEAQRDLVEEQRRVRTPDVYAPFRSRVRAQRANWFVPVEPEVAGEVVARS